MLRKNIYIAKETNYYRMKNWFYYTLCILLLACSPKKSEQADNSATAPSIVENKPTEVSVLPLEYTDFNDELKANGIVSAQNKADLRFQMTEIVSAIYVKNGDRVRKGQEIAKLDQFKLENSLDQAKDNLDKALLDLQDELLKGGFELNDTANISVESLTRNLGNMNPENALQSAIRRSNYNQTKRQYEMAVYNYKNSVLYAPFDGIVANLFSKVYNPPNGSEQFCTIIDNQNMEISFNILETELHLIKINDKVLVSPFSQTALTVEGYISEINPVIDKNGMVKIKALIKNTDSKFYEGMNVKIRVQRFLSKQLVIPKSALVLRDKREVVFKLENNKSIWVYVEKMLENSTSYVVNPVKAGDLKAGDTIIYDGIINLSHEAPVIVKN